MAFTQVRVGMASALVSVALALAGCGGGTADTPARAAMAAPAPQAAAPAALDVPALTAPATTSTAPSLLLAAASPHQRGIRVPGAEGAVIAVYQALYGMAPGYAQLQTLTAAANANLNAGLANIAANFAGMSDADLTRQVLANMRVTSQTVGPPTASNLQTLLAQLFAAYGPGSRAAIILNLANILSDLEADSLYGPAAVGFNIQTLANRDYAVNPANTVDAALAQPAVFAFAAAYKRNATASSQRGFTVSGTCSGTGSTVQSGLSSTRFNGVAAFSKTLSLSVSFTACTQSSLAGTSVSYYDANLVPIGGEVPGSNYEVLGAANVPTSVAVGSTGVLVTGTIYSDSSKRTVLGSETVSYSVEADGPNTAIARFISRSYDTLGHLTATEQIRARIDLGGGYTVLTDDIQYSYTSSVHLLITYL